MADGSAIEWTDATWNPITGCSRVSAGCQNCYAERLAATRLQDHPSRKGLTDRNGRWSGEARLNPAWLAQPLRWQRPRRIFAVAHGDLFHEAVPEAWIDLIFAVMAIARRHRFQILTKRPRRMRDYARSSEGRVNSLISHWLRDGDHPAIPLADRDRRRLARLGMLPRGTEGLFAPLPLPNVWLGTSLEDQDTANERIPPLLETPAAVRWLSAEPLLGPVEVFSINGPVDVPDGMLPPLDWVVAGGESGPGARPMHPDWARSLRDQCAAAGVPFFFKQWGGASSKALGRELDGRTWDEMPGGSGGWQPGTAR